MIKYLLVIFFLQLELVCFGQYQQFPAHTPPTIKIPNGSSLGPSLMELPGEKHKKYKHPSRKSHQHKFHIVLQNDSAFTVRTKVDPIGVKHFVIVEGKQDDAIYFPPQTKSFSRILENGKRWEGIPADSCWYFKVASGRLNLYSFLPEQTLENVIAIQEGDNGKIVRLSEEGLKKIVGDDPKIQSLIEKRKFIRAIQLYNKGGE